MNYPQVLTVKEVSEILRCSLGTAYEMCESGVLKTFRLKPGSQKGIRVLRDSLDELMRGRPEKDAPPETGKAPATPKPKFRAKPMKGNILNFKA